MQQYVCNAIISHVFDPKTTRLNNLVRHLSLHIKYSVELSASVRHEAVCVTVLHGFSMTRPVVPSAVP
jgi:hypothetical protein